MKQIIAVASGKGGVGKSTVAANLAVALANNGPEGSAGDAGPKRVALLDIDFYGPSIPTIMGGGEIKLDDQQKFIPALKYNVKFMSIAFFLKAPDDPIIWRGPMFGKAINQLFDDVNWGEVDICIVDMPPGTGDAQLSLSQLVQLDGALMVTTPQEVALSDVRRAINMFRKVNVDILGIVENMSGFVLPSGETVPIFGEGGGEALSERYDIPLLGSIPLDTAVREGGDAGKPSALDPSTRVGACYADIASRLWQVLQVQASASPKLEVSN